MQRYVKYLTFPNAYTIIYLYICVLQNSLPISLVHTFVIIFLCNVCTYQNLKYLLATTLPGIINKGLLTK